MPVAEWLELLVHHTPDRCERLVRDAVWYAQSGAWRAGEGSMLRSVVRNVLAPATRTWASRRKEHGVPIGRESLAVYRPPARRVGRRRVLPVARPPGSAAAR